MFRKLFSRIPYQIALATPSLRSCPGTSWATSMAMLSAIRSRSLGRDVHTAVLLLAHKYGLDKEIERVGASQRGQRTEELLARGGSYLSPLPTEQHHENTDDEHDQGYSEQRDLH